jgi:hypothetical protein
MAFCNKCVNYDKNYSEFRKLYEDVIKIDGDKREKDFCTMYDDFIPLKITYDGANCPYFLPKEES